MSRKANCWSGGGTGATLAVAQYGIGWRGHHDMTGGRGFQLGMFCGDGSRVERMLERVEERVKPTEAEKAVFADFRAAAKAAAEKVKSTCPIEAPRIYRSGSGWPRNALKPHWMQSARCVLQPGKLYAALTDEQKAEVNGMRDGRGS